MAATRQCQCQGQFFRLEDWSAMNLHGRIVVLVTTQQWQAVCTCVQLQLLFGGMWHEGLLTITTITIRLTVWRFFVVTARL